MSKILLLGDAHGQFSELIHLQKEAIAANLGIDFCVQVGDFGYYERCFETLNKMNIKKFPIKTYTIDGNHECHSWLKEQNHKEWEEKHNLFYMPRGSVLEIDGNVICFLGGSLNVDRAQEGSINKRTTNYILDLDIHEALEKFLKYPVIDLMVTHSCPHSMGIGMVGSPIFAESITKFCHDKGHSTGNIWDCGEGPLTRLFRSLKTANVKVANAVYGHFHQTHYKKVDDTHFYCVGSSDCSDGKFSKNPFIYDTQKKEVEWLSDVYLDNFTGHHKTKIKDDSIRSNPFDKL
jgi:predicted phosphodiesterase